MKGKAMNMAGCLFCGEEKGFFGIPTDEHPNEHSGMSLGCFCEKCFNARSVEELTDKAVDLWVMFWHCDPAYSPEWFQYCIERKKGLNPTPIPRPKRPPTVEERIADLEQQISHIRGFLNI